jgi:hypothetical protein
VVSSYMKQQARSKLLLMPGVCLSSWQTYPCEWSIGSVWRSSDWIERGIYIAFVLMLAYTVFVLVRFFPPLLLSSP